MNHPNKPLEDMDLAIIRELENDPLVSNTELGMRLYASRNTIARRIQQFQDEQIISISIIRHTAGFGYNTIAFFFFKVDENKSKAVAEALSRYPLIDQVNIITGQYDVMAFGRFRDNQDLSHFLRDGIGSIPNIIGCQTMVVLSAAKTSKPLIEQYKDMLGHAKTTPCTDELELKIIDELEKDPRRSHTDLARQLGVVRHTISRKVNELIDRRVISIVTYVSPTALGYRTLSVIMFKVRPCAIDSVVERLGNYPEIQDVIIGTGHCDIIALAVFHNADELFYMAKSKLSAIPGVLSYETIVIQSETKNSSGLQGSGIMEDV